MLLAGKKVVVVGGSSGIGLATAEMAKREGAEVIIASRNVERLDKAAEKLNAIAIPADVTSDDSVAELFQRCGPVDHVVVTAAQLRTGPFKTVAMEDVRGTMEGKFWGAWRVAQQAQNPRRRIADAGVGFPQRSSAAEFGDRQRRQRRAGIAGKSAGARTGAGARQLLFRPGSSIPRSAPRCRKRRGATCWRRRRRRCRSAASALARISRGKSSVSWRTALRPDRSSISTAGRW